MFKRCLGEQGMDEIGEKKSNISSWIILIK